MSLNRTLQKLSETTEQVYSMIAKVLTISTLTCSVKGVRNEVTYPSVKLTAVGGANGFIVRPKVNSFVLITFIAKEKPFVSMVDDIEDITIMGGALEGLVTVNELVNRLNGIENKVNNLITKYNAHIHTTTATVSTGAPGILAAPGTTETPISPITVKADIENPKIKQ